MPLLGAGTFPAVVALGVVLLLLAAKAHGRQVRLEREAAGYTDVRFDAENPPFVEALWRRDRRRFLPGFGAGLAAVSAYFGLVAGAVLAPPAYCAAGCGPILVPALVALALWPPVPGFLAAGLSSWVHRSRSRGPATDRQTLDRGTVAYWTSVALLALATLALSAL